MEGRNRAISQNLVDAGCDSRLVVRFFALENQGSKEDQLDLLAVHRRALLEDIHKLQKRLDCLDYLLYHMRNKSENE